MKIAKPFTNIALSLSGGGYRATTFHLGAMAYLNAIELDGKNLLHNVKIISTISGGTLTGVMYAHKLSQNGDFQDCFDKLYFLLTEDKLVDRALHKLNKPKNWTNDYKSRDAINAFSEVYNEDFYDKATFGDLYRTENKHHHLTDAIFGSSEFTYGIQFRFQEKHDNARFGNGKLNIPTPVSNHIRLADATAASSCFPGGFEPMIMPKDFGNGPKSEVDKYWFSNENSKKPYPSTAIMDGGIIDNQGIEGVKLVEERRAKKENDQDKDEVTEAFIGTYLVSDVSAENMKPYKVPVLKHSSFKNIFTLNRINFALLISFAVIVGLLFTGLATWAIILCSVFLTLMGIYLIVFLSVRNLIRKALGENFGEDAVPELMHDFGVLRRTPIYILVYLIKFRVSSVVKMVSNVFLRRIRRLQLDSLYEDNTWNYRFKSNYIYSLIQKKASMSDALAKVIKMANSMPTTLWFSSEEKKGKMLDNLIAAGQITMCYNLISYAKKIKSKKYKAKVWDVLTDADRDAITVLQTSMEADLQKFQENPFWLLEENKANRRFPKTETA